MLTFSRRALAVVISLALMAPAAPVWAEGEVKHWLPAFYAAPEPSGSTEAIISDMTLRQIVKVSAGGERVRVRLSNAYGDKPLRLADVRIARRMTGSGIETASDRGLTFNGAAGVTLAPGAYVISDPADIKVTAMSDLAISFYAKDPVPLKTVHDIQRGVLYRMAGAQAATERFAEETINIGLGNAFPFVSGVEVESVVPLSTVIAFGDSITDGFGITPDTGRTWPDVFNGRLKVAGLPVNVINAGISGNRMLHHGTWARFGTGALARFDRDVLSQNAAAVIILIGINDLGHAKNPDAEDYVSAQDLIGGLKQMALRARARNMKIYVATLTPFKGTVFKDYYTDHKESERQTLNAWLRQSQDFDGVFDFDKALEDPERPGWLKAGYDLGDHLHPNDAGAAAMAQAIPLSAFGWVK
ncbi:SGNH/GDSL hydrolase family protein [Asticcacaulis machinosus]|uniref:SGNH/GDSL hydrolase family protein n=1 Tax=Asticcacaulis machinosus TaxID=2984211 RepID=A0ABT5HGE7_9CAUL|nr:SGNH/GDSL hydrolase family protein [Asticcacaulis machinosus]MDC7675068.1 SGNH/GDSL hydrolase family protein [Asticcacaulis machinosus]